MKRRNLTLVLSLATASGACFVDLERNETFLSVTLEALSSLAPSPSTVVLRLDGEEGLDPFETRLPIEPGDGGRARLPLLGATAGRLQLELRLLDAAGVELDRPRTHEVRLRRGETTAILIAFSEIPSTPGPNGQAPRHPVSGLAVVERLGLADTPVVSVAGGGSSSTEVPIDAGSLSGLLGRLESDLGGPPVRLDLRSLVIAALPESAGSSPPELDDVFAGEVSVSLRSSALGELEIGRFFPRDADTLEVQLAPTVNLDAWLDALPSDAALVLTGPVDDDDDDDPPIRLRVTLLFSGAS